MTAWQPAAWPTPDIQRLADSLYPRVRVHQSELPTDQRWKYLFTAESAPRSHYDVLIEASRGGSPLPDGILCLAGAGRNFHGFKNRPWTASSGNIHLSVYLAPRRPVNHFAVGFTVLAAVSAIDALDSVPGLQRKAGIKWVNDVLIDEAKVCGVLAHTQSVGDILTGAVIGIGMNVETRPSVEPTPFVPKVASVRDFLPDAEVSSQGHLFRELIRALDRNYRLLLDGRYNVLLGRYRERALALGRNVRLASEGTGREPDTLAAGRVTGIGENLELFIEGYDRPFSRGRLILEPGPKIGSR